MEFGFWDHFNRKTENFMEFHGVWDHFKRKTSGVAVKSMQATGGRSLAGLVLETLVSEVGEAQFVLARCNGYPIPLS